MDKYIMEILANPVPSQGQELCLLKVQQFLVYTPNWKMANPSFPKFNKVNLMSEVNQII